MQSLPASLLATAQEPQTEKHWIYLYEMEVDANPSQTLVTCFTNHNEPVTSGGKTYQPFPCTHSGIEVDSEAQLPRVDLTLSNVTRELGPFLEEGEGFIGRPVVLSLTTAEDAEDLISLEVEVAGCELRDEAVVFSLEGYNFNDIEFPPEPFSRDRCVFVFKGTRCRYRGPEVLCLKRITDCVEYGNAEVARGYPRTHPRQFGGFPGLTKQAS